MDQQRRERLQTGFAKSTGQHHLGHEWILLPSSPIAPGQNVTFALPVTAPVTPGNYTFAWQMVQEGVQWFGVTYSTTIHVGNSAAVVSANVKAIVATGETFTATITMKNDGGTVWTNTGATPYRLGSQTPQNNTTWGTNRDGSPPLPSVPATTSRLRFLPKPPPVSARSHSPGKCCRNLRATLERRSPPISAWFSRGPDSRFPAIP